MATEARAAPWTEKYRPKTLKQVVGNATAIRKIVRWLKGWRARVPSKRAILLHGPPGTGKTVTVEAIAHDYGFHLTETNASDFRTPKKIARAITRSIDYQTIDTLLQGGEVRRIVLFDEVDGITGREDRGGVGAILRVVKNSRIPVFLTANDAYQPNLRSLRSQCLLIPFNALSESEVAAHLKEICANEGIDAEDEAATLLANNASGDMRAAISDLQVLCEAGTPLTVADVGVHTRNRQAGTFDALRRFFAAKTRLEARRAVEEATIHYDAMMHCIHESLPYQFRDAQSLVTAYTLLAAAETFLHRARRRRAWHLLWYFFELLASIPLTRHAGYPSHYVKFSQRMIQMGRSRSHRRLRQEVSRLIGEKCHVSVDTALKEILPYLKVMMRADPTLRDELRAGFGLDQSMLAYLAA
jgi:replication factor C large subunit